MNPSIKRRLLYGLLSLTAVVCIIASVRSYFETRHEIEELFDAQLVQSARILLELSTHELYEQLAYLSQIQGKGDEISGAIPIQIHKYEQSLEFQVWTHDSRLAIRSENAPNTQLTAEEEVFKDLKVNGNRWRVYAISNKEKTVQVQVAEYYDQRNRLANTISIRLILTLLSVLLLLAIVISFVVGRAMEPLNKIARDVKLLESDNLHSIDSKNVPKEALPMITALNHLLERLRVAFENNRRFTADAAHELRTPLAGVKVNSQVALLSKDSRSRDAALHEVISSVNSATQLVAQLLMLSRLDPEADVISDEVADLKQIAVNTIADLAHQALEKHIEIGMEADDAMYVEGRGEMIPILIRNIVYNAIQYTPHYGIIAITIEQKEERIRLRVADSGPGIPQSERNNVFRRFHRGAGHDVPGTGLGLSIVNRIVEIHHGEIVLGQSIQQGLQFDVYFNKAKNNNILDEYTYEPKMVASGR